ncbi:MAG: hypothetical protein QOH32_502 [Bradyrhizobium sp.]|jgi:hypothetical protein|nr:hypothetical protein [Bradyrhizobium sp.]
MTAADGPETGGSLRVEGQGHSEMPRYFFDVIDGHRLPDPAGLECRDDEEATAHARTIARQIAVDAPGSSQRHIVVINDDREEVGAVPVAAEVGHVAGRKI